MQPSDESLFLFLLLVLVAEDDEVFCVSILPLIVALIAISPTIVGQSIKFRSTIFRLYRVIFRRTPVLGFKPRIEISKFLYFCTYVQS